MKLFTKQNCPACETVKKFIADANITDIQICDATNDLVVKQNMTAFGCMTFPALEGQGGRFLFPSQTIIEFLADRENKKGATI